MPTLNEPKYTGEFIGELALGPGYHCDAGTLISGQNLTAGTVVGKITASGKFTILAPAASDGSQNAVGIIVPNTDASSADKTTRFLVRGPAQVNANDLVWPGGINNTQKSAALAQLLALGIKAA